MSENSYGHQHVDSEGVGELKVVYERTDVQIKYATMLPGKTIPWHFHTSVRDLFYVVEGSILVRSRPGHQDEIVEDHVGVGECLMIEVNSPHTVVNTFEGTTIFLLIQGVGDVDLVKV